MNLKEFEKRRKAIWAKYEREFGSLIAQKLRDLIGETIRLSSDDEETLDDLDGYLSSNIPIWKTILLLKGGSSAARDSAKAKPQNRYRKCFERRFYLVNFVINRPYKRGTRIDWKRMVAKWNETHPSDRMSLSVLRVEYHRAIKEDDLMLQVFISQSNQFYASLWRLTEMSLRDMANNNPAASQKLRNDYQPLFKAIETCGHEEVARLNSEYLDDIRALADDINRLSTTKEAQHERTHS